MRRPPRGRPEHPLKIRENPDDRRPVRRVQLCGRRDRLESRSEIRFEPPQDVRTHLDGSSRSGLRQDSSFRDEVIICNRQLRIRNVSLERLRGFL